MDTVKTYDIIQRDALACDYLIRRDFSTPMDIYEWPNRVVKVAFTQDGEIWGPQN